MSEIRYNSREIVNSFTDEELMEFIFDSTCPCFCEICLSEILTGEPDLDGINYDCPVCESEGKHVKSVLVLANLI